MSGRDGRILTAVGGLTAAIFLGAAAVPPGGDQNGTAENPEASNNPSRHGGDGLSPYERLDLQESVRANGIAEAQQRYALFQLFLGGAGVVFTGFAAFWAWRATHWAKEAASAARVSAEADNKALAEAQKAAADARKDAVEAAIRFEKQMAKQQEMVEFTAKSSYAMEHSASATRGMARAMRENAETSLKAVEASNTQLELSRKALIVDQRPWVGVFGVHLERLEIDLQGARLKMTLHLKNTGKTPAHRVGIKARLHAEPTIKASRDELIHIYNTADRSPEYPDQVMACIFPQQDHKPELTVVCHGEQIQSFPVTSGERRLLFTITGFVIYESEVSGEATTHVSSFIYRVVRNPNSYLTLGENETFARYDSVHLKANHVSPGWYAD